jgi:predicted permease
VNDVPFTIIGIAPPEFVGPQPGRANLFLPIASVSLLHPNDPSVPSFLYKPDDCCSDVVGRLAPDATREQARAELDLLSRQFQSQAGTEVWRILVTGTEFLARPGRKNQILAIVGLLSAGLVLVWLLACANIGNLQIARAANRAQEIGIRLSLGASRGRVIRQLLTEGFMLSLAAGGLGVGLAYVLPPLVLRLVADGGSAPFSLAPDGLVLSYAVLLAGASSIAFGLAPAWHATRADVANVLRSREGPGQSGFRLRSLLLGVQVAVSVVLLVSAGLLVRAAQQRAGGFDPGFSVSDVTVVSFELPAAYDEARSEALLADLTGALRGSPGNAFGFASQEPLAQSRAMTHIRLPGASTAQPKPIIYLDVSPGYFDVLRIPIVAGRPFRSAETPGAGAVLINESMARLYWPKESGWKDVPCSEPESVRVS